VGRNLAELGGKALLCPPQVVPRLQPRPQIRPVATKLSKSQRDSGRYGRRTGEDTMKRLPRHPQLSRRLTHREVERWEHVVPKYLAGMHRCELPRATGLDLSHVGLRPFLHTMTQWYDAQDAAGVTTLLTRS
jgi:hypothetical protein